MSAQRAELLQKELSIFTYNDLIQHYPFRHIDRTNVDKINGLNSSQEYAYVAATLVSAQVVGDGRAKRLVAKFEDGTGTVESVWFQGIQWIQKMLVVGRKYLVFGRLSFFMANPQIPHPELEIFSEEKSQGKQSLEPIYPTTEKLKIRGINGREFASLIRQVLLQIKEEDFPENIPAAILKDYKLMDRITAMKQIHFPTTEQHFKQALRRLKFEELLMAQLRVQLLKMERHRFSKGFVFKELGDAFNEFYANHLPFTLTNAQKKVVKDIRADIATGKQMNRLLQGDVGSGKTIVALLCMLIAAGNDFQSVMMAPTEILATQHFHSLTALLEKANIKVSLLTGSVKGKARKLLLQEVAEGTVHILVGTHAVIEEKVVFKNLGFAVIDEQHKFGVAQRARLWNKNALPPHILVMTATPIPRTLALTAYGDLDYSVMDELPPGRIPIVTYHKNENKRPEVMAFVRQQLEQGRQAYFIYPLIEESSKLDFENLMQGYQEVTSFFPEPKFYVSMVHGKLPPEQKETNMQRFVKNDTQIMVSTTVIEVGVNVPNATVMVIESAERFGLAQLHQLRGRVGRGAEKSYCVLLTSSKIGKESRERMSTMVATNDGFKIAEKDLELRGPGEIEGTKQSGALNFKLASIINDRAMLEVARAVAEKILTEDNALELPQHGCILNYLQKIKGKTKWSKIS